MEHQVHACSLTENLHKWLATSQQPRILHVFDLACNLTNERKEILSVVTPKIGCGPLNLVLETELLFSEYLNIDSKISIHDGQLKLGNLRINMAGAELWNPRPDWEELYARRHPILSQLEQLPITNYQSNSALDFSDHQISSFSHAVAKADLAVVKNISVKIAGLGSGLTPAADDFLVGAIYAAWIIHPKEVARALVQEIANVAAPLTTSLSAALLESAARGEAGNLWHEFFGAITVQDSERIQHFVNDLLAVGETSGADALAGLTNVFSAWARVKGRSNG